ncbi:MAG: hypothetical protein H7Y30_12990 [Pyrinomonadaceae bacterium]|nr:hypothetical protein [Pyrinomonadaceae bacterium]
MNKSILITALVVFAGAYMILAARPVCAQAAATPSREASEKAIRTIVYESAMSAQTGDVKLYRRNLAKRSFELVKLVYQGLQELPEDNQVLIENNFDTVDKFLDATFVQGASQYANLSKEKKEDNARAQAAGKITFLSDKEAVIAVGDSSLRLVWEDNAWKVDETETGKKMWLQNFQFKQATREKIEKL